MKYDSTSVKSQYSRCEDNREPFLRRARKASSLTLPFLIAPDGHTGASDLPTPYQSMGARGVTNLAAKLLLALLPPDNPFFRYDVDKFQQEEFSEDEKVQFDKILSDVETSVMNFIESSPIRTAAFEMLKHLIVGGNVLIHYQSEKDKSDLRVFGVDRYIVKRAPTGKALEIIVKEMVVPNALSQEILEHCQCKPDSGDSYNKPIQMYTKVWWDNMDNKYHVSQLINDIVVPDSEGTYTENNVPFRALRLHRIDGESYGRGLVEQYLGDLISLESLHESIVKASAAAAKVIFLLAPNGVTKADDLNKAPTGAFRTGNAEDVSTIQMGKYNDFRVALETINRIEARLSSAFMLRESIQRDAERVTAEEIRYMATELDEAQGGIYSILAQEWQLPLVHIVTQDMTKKKLLPALPKQLLTPVITTGLDALGRTNDLIKLDNMVERVFTLDPQLADKYINMGEYLRRRGSALKVETDGLLKSEEQVQAQQQAEQQQQMMQQGIPNAVSQIGQMAQQQQQKQTK